MTTKCDILRDMTAAIQCGLCTGSPIACPAGLPAVLCGIPNAANNRMALFADKYNPMNLFLDAADRKVLRQTEQNLVAGIQTTEQGLRTAYPGAPPEAVQIAWPDLQYCLWNKEGRRGGPFSNVYFGRDDAQAFKMIPTYPVGGTLAQGALWPPPKTSPVPLIVDYVANPDLAVILIFALLVIVFAVLVWVAFNQKKKAPFRSEQEREAERKRLEATDPFRGTAFESYPDPLAKCRTYVESMEQQGYDMAYYRQQCGLPAKP
jgi:hypothetical protein